ncbi:hypothetical protein Syun_029017 [Stephania yunnanensis]|uniref:Uncharacterized protein n=1 Tax=Stephania yunnanensis TaxID=152371 RepID=A0AAP0HFN3_9MAGN
MVAEEEAALPPSKSTSSVQSQFSETVNSSAEDGASFETDVSTVSQAASIYGASQTPLLASYASTPKLTPPGSPPTSPRRHSTSFSTTRGTFDDRSSIFSSMPSWHHSSLSSSSDLGSQSVVAESMASESDLSSWTDLLHSSTKLLEQVAPSAQFPLLRFGFFEDPRFGLRCDGLCCCSGDRQKNSDQSESLSQKLKAMTLRTEAPAQSVSVEQLTSTFPLSRSGTI